MTQNSTAKAYIDIAAAAIFHSEYADRHEVTVGDARALAATALGHDTRKEIA